MLKLEFLRYWSNLSDRQVIQRTETDLAYRYFLDVGYTFRPPDSSSLSYFRGRLGEQGFVAVFDQLVAQARRAGLVKDRLRLKDASHVVASIAVPTTLTLVAQIRDRLLLASEPFDPDWVSGQRIEVNLLRERTKDHAAEARLAARVTHLQELVAWAETVPSPTDAETNSAWKQFEQTRALARKILQDRAPNAERKTLSVHDPEARRGKHGAYYDGYLTDILMDADSGLLTQINVLAAGGDEARDAVELVRAEQTVHGNQIEGLSIDGAGFHGPMLRELEGPAGPAAQAETAAQTRREVNPPSLGLGVKVFVPPTAEPKTERFTAADFHLQEDGKAVTCPAGQTSQYQGREAGRNATVFRFQKATCEACPLLGQCMGQLGHGKSGRSVTKNDYEEEYARIRQRAQTETFAEVRREHPAVERKLNELMNHHGGRRARYWGRAKVHIQELMTGLVVNTKRIVALMIPLRAEQTATCAAAI